MLWPIAVLSTKFKCKQNTLMSTFKPRVHDTFHVNVHTLHPVEYVLSASTHATSDCLLAPCPQHLINSGFVLTQADSGM